MATNINLSLTRSGDVVKIDINYTDPNGVAQTSSLSVLVPDSIPAPVITSFTAAASTINAGSSTTLTAMFSNGAGSVDNGIGAIQNNISVNVSPTTTTTYKLTVVNSSGANISATTTINVIQPVPSPVISNFTANPASITAGASSALTATFSNGTGVINNGVGNISSGMSVSVSPTTNTTYTLTVTNSAGQSISANASVAVSQPVPNPIITSFTSNTDTIVAGGTATLTATFSNGTGNVNNGVGSVSSGAAFNVSPLSTTTYILTVSNSAGVSITASKTINVSQTALTCLNKVVVEGKSNTSMSALSKPARGITIDEPNFGICFTRATDYTADGLRTFARNDYSRRQAYNCDNSLYLIYDLNGSWYIYDAKTYKKVKELTMLGGDCEPQWHHSDPALLYYLPLNGGTKVFLLNVNTLQQTTAADFIGKTPFTNAAHIWTKSEGSPSKDNRYWGFQVENSNFGILGYITWDMVENKLIGSMAANATGVSSSRPDHCSMCPSGKWMTISWDAPAGTWAYSLDFKTKKKLHTSSEHSDLAIGKNGNDIYVSIDYSDGNVFMYDIETSIRTNLFPTYINGAASALHFSGKGYNKPGWVIMSAYEEYGPTQWYMKKVYAVELASNSRVYQLAYTRCDVSGQYFAEPHASVNRDFTLINFNSNWGVKGSQNVDCYQLKLSPIALP